MPQYSFSTQNDVLIKEIDSLSSKESRSRSEMIELLLTQAVKERFRKKNAKQKNNTEHYTSN